MSRKVITLKGTEEELAQRFEAFTAMKKKAAKMKEEAENLQQEAYKVLCTQTAKAGKGSKNNSAPVQRDLFTQIDTDTSYQCWSDVEGLHIGQIVQCRNYKEHEAILGHAKTIIGADKRTYASYTAWLKMLVKMYNVALPHVNNLSNIEAFDQATREWKPLHWFLDRRRKRIKNAANNQQPNEK